MSTPETSNKQLVELARLGLQMRDAQKRYFNLAKNQVKYPGQMRQKREALENSKRLERTFDELCKSTIEYANQQSLFGPK